MFTTFRQLLTRIIVPISRLREGLAYYDWASISNAADGSLTNGVAEANIADVLCAPSRLGSVLYGYRGNGVLGGGADCNFGGTT